MLSAVIASDRSVINEDGVTSHSFSLFINQPYRCNIKAMFANILASILGAFFLSLAFISFTSNINPSLHLSLVRRVQDLTVKMSCVN